MKKRAVIHIRIATFISFLTLACVSVFSFFGCSSYTNVLSPSQLASKSSSQSVNVQSPGYIFRRGDQLKFTVRGYPEFDTTATINDAGNIFIRLIGDIHLAGNTRAQVIDSIKTKLSLYVKTEVIPSFDLINSLEQKVAVIGAVGKQENYTIPTEVTVLQILAMAGGAMPDADLHHVKIFRNGENGSAEEVDVTQYISKGTIAEMPLVKPGDTVYIPPEENLIRELSNFFRDTIFLFTLFTISN